MDSPVVGCIGHTTAARHGSGEAESALCQERFGSATMAQKRQILGANVASAHMENKRDILPPKPRHSKPSINSDDKVPSSVVRSTGLSVFMDSRRYGAKPSSLVLRSNGLTDALWPSGTPMVHSRTQEGAAASEPLCIEL